MSGFAVKPDVMGEAACASAIGGDSKGAGDESIEVTQESATE